MRRDLLDSANIPEAPRLLIALLIVLFLFAVGVI
jgi:hypothetical protein